jgi:hypothetical protein
MEIFQLKNCCGKGVVSDVLHTAGNVSKLVGLGVARKHITAPKNDILERKMIF